MKKNIGKIPNVKVYLLSILVIIFAVKTIGSNIESNISIVNYTKFIFGAPAIIFGVLSFSSFTYILITKKFYERFERDRKIITIVLLIFFIIYALEFALLHFIRTLIYVSTLTRIPDQKEFLNSLAYILNKYAMDFVRGVFTTLKLAYIGTLNGLIIAFIFVIFRTLKINPKDIEIVVFFKKLAVFITKTYVNIFRGTPMIVQAVIIFYLLPVVIAKQFGLEQEVVNKVLTVTVTAIIVVSLNTTAYLTEVLRGGIESIDKGQLEAARSLGMGYWQSMFSIVLPQAFKNSLPAIGNEFVINIKDTAVLNVIMVADLFFAARNAQNHTYRTYEPFIIAAVIYFMLTMSLSWILAFIEKKMNLESKPLPSSN